MTVPERAEVLLCINDGFAQHAAVCLRSLAANMTRPIRVTIAGIEIQPETRDRLATSVADFSRLSLRFHDFNPGLVASLPTHRVYPQDIYVRLWLGDFYEPDVQRVIYLDADIVCIRAIDPLWEMDLAGNTIAAVPIPGSTAHERCRLPLSEPYVNSGVLVIDLPSWRDRQVLARLLSFLNENRSTIRNPDQDAINGSLYQERMLLDYTWNVITPFFRKDAGLGLPKAVLRRVCAQARIVHFNGSSKPWYFMDRHMYKYVYWKHLRETSWRAYREPDRTPLNMAKKGVVALLPGTTIRGLRSVLGRSKGC